jgi:hypothetical protein
VVTPNKDTKMICFEIDPKARSIRAIDLPAIPDGYGDDPRYLDDEGDVIYTERSSENTHGFVLDGVRPPLVGVAYVMGTDQDGNDVPPKVAYDWLVEHIDFGHVCAGMFRGERHVRAIQ